MKPSAAAQVVKAIVPHLSRTPGNLLQRQCTCGNHSPAAGECEECRQKRQASMLQRAAVNSSPVSAVPPVVSDVIRSAGQALDTATLDDMEPRFGQEFSQVRVHTGAKAAASAQAVNALAYTVGSDVVFGRGQYSPHSGTGRQLLAHELAHVVQQGGASPAGELKIGAQDSVAERAAESAARLVSELHLSQSPVGPTGKVSAGQVYRSLLQRAPAPPAPGVIVTPLLMMASGRVVGSTASPTDNLREEVLLAMDRLLSLGSMKNADYTVEQPLVKALPAGSQVTIPIPKTLAAIKQNAEGWLPSPKGKYVLSVDLSANIGEKQANKKNDLLAAQSALQSFNFLAAGDYKAENSVVSKEPGSAIKDNLIPKTIAALSDIKMAIAGGSFVPGVARTNLFAATHPVSPKEHAQVEAILTPGAKLVNPPAVKGLPPPPPVVVLPPAMKGMGVGGPFETDMKAAIVKYVGAFAKNFRALKAAGPPAFPIAKANDLSQAAQEETEGYFKPFIKVAPRVPSAPYHSGSYNLSAKLGDQSTRPLTDAGSPGNPGRIGWMSYWMTHDDGKAVLAKYNVIPTRVPDDAEFDRVQNLIATDPANRADIDDAIHSWPAEATGGIFIQPYQTITNTDSDRTNRWNLFTTLIHEMMHDLAHDNFRKTWSLIGGNAQEVLKEGFADVFRHELWDGPGNLVKKIATKAYEPLRLRVEGAKYPYKASVVVPHSYYAETEDAKKIVSKVGMPNAKAAYFLGHVELLGLGAGTASAQPLANVAMFDPKQAAEKDVIVVAPGESYADIQTRTNAPKNGILDAAGKVVPAATPLVAGSKLRVPGIRYVTALSGETLGSIANENALPVATLAKANKLAALTPETFSFPVGTQVLIPIHKAIP